MSKKVLQLSGIAKTFLQGTRPLEILKKVDLIIYGGEIVGLVGPSGSGKSTLLQIAGLLEKPQEGTVSILEKAMNQSNEQGRTKTRRSDIGFVYQYHHLLDEFTALENVLLPQLIAGKDRDKALLVAEELLESLELSERSGHRPARLSGGEQQRVAVARALANNPKLILADEPTGNLDPETAENVFNILVKLVKKNGIAVLIATHNPDLASRMDRITRLENGILLSN